MRAVIGLVFVMGLCHTASIPSYINVCRRTDPNVNQCILNAVEQLKPKLREGIPELHVPPMEPLKVAPIVIDRGTGNTVFKLTLDDIELFGTSDFKTNSLKLDTANHIYKVDISFPKMQLRGTCDVDTKLLSLPINGKGDFTADVFNCHATGILKAEIYDKNGVKYMRFSDLTLNLDIGDYAIKVDNLFEDDALSQTVNELVNQNKENLIQIAKPFIEEKASQIILEMSNHIVDTFPYDDLFPEN